MKALFTRLLYLTLGVFLSLGFATRKAQQLTNAQWTYYQRSLTPFLLTAYSDGWGKGRDYTTGFYSHIIMQYADEMDACRMEINELKHVSEKAPLKIR
jgi:hypothetical protein